MSKKPDEEASIIKPMIDELKGTHAHKRKEDLGAPSPPGPGDPPQPAELDDGADDGGDGDDAPQD